jgi:rod shape-determining protein MreD
MKNIILSILLFAAALAQATLINGISVFGVKPDLFWIMVLAGGLYFDLAQAVIMGLACGILKDCLGASSSGVYTVLFPLWAFGVKSLSKRISFDQAPVAGVFLAVMIFVNAAILRSVPVASSPTISFLAFMRVAVLESLYTAALFVWIGPLLRRVAVSTLW